MDKAGYPNVARQKLRMSATESCPMTRLAMWSWLGVDNVLG